MNAILVSLALASWSAIDLDQEVTFENPGGTMTAVLGKLGEKAGVEFDVHADIAKEIVMLRLDKVPLNKALDKIVDVTGGKWFEQSGKVRVIVDLDRRTRDEANFVRNRIAEAVKAKERLKKSSTLQTYKDEDGEEYTVEPSVADILLDQIVQQIPNNVFAQIRTGDRLVFSTNPTQTQRAIPGFNNGLIEKWVAEHNESVADQGQIQTDDMDGLDGIPPEILERMMARFKKFEGAPSRMMLIIQAGSNYFSGSGLSARLVLYNQAGKGAIEHSTSIGEVGWEEMVPSPVPDEVGSKPEEEAPRTKITYPKELTDLQELYKSRYVGGMPGPTPEKLQEIMTSPQTHEPLAYAMGYAMVEASRVKGLNLVASLEDRYASSGSELNLMDTVEQLAQTLDEQLVEKDGWWTAMPADPKTARETRIDRASLAEFIKESQTRFVSLDTVAALYAKNDVREPVNLLSSIVQRVCPQAVTSIFGASDPQEYRLYGQLSASDRLALKNGSRVSISQLSPAAQKTLSRLVYGSGTRLEVVTGNEVFGRKMLLDQAMFFDGSDQGPELKTEPTLIAPTGLPMYGYIAARVAESPYFVVQPGADVPSELGIQFGYEELALFRAMMSVPEFASEGANFLPMFDKMTRGTRDEWSIRIFVAQDVVHKIELNDARPPGTELFSIRKLPQDVEDVVAKKVEEIKKSPFFSMMSSGMGSSRGPIKP